MTKKSFYLTLNILNVLLCVYMYAMFFVCFIFLCMDCIDEKCIFSLSVIWSIIIIKFFVLYILFKLIKKYFPDFVLNKVAENLKADKTARKRALLLAIAYDLPIMFLFAFNATIDKNLADMFYIFKWDYLFDFIYFAFGYEVISVGGVLTFYLSTFCLWKIEDKIKSFYNKK